MGSNYFFKVSAALLLTTAVAKAYSALGPMKILQIDDPVLFLKTRTVLFLAATVELAVAACLWRHRDMRIRGCLLLWLTLNFIYYRFGNALFAEAHCKCLGALGDRLPLSPRSVDAILIGCLAFFFVGSILSLMEALFGRRSPARRPSA